MYYIPSGFIVALYNAFDKNGNKAKYLTLYEILTICYFMSEYYKKEFNSNTAVNFATGPFFLTELPSGVRIFDGEKQRQEVENYATCIGASIDKFSSLDSRCKYVQKFILPQLRKIKPDANVYANRSINSISGNKYGECFYRAGGSRYATDTLRCNALVGTMYKLKDNAKDNTVLLAELNKYLKGEAFNNTFGKSGKKLDYDVFIDSIKYAVEKFDETGINANHNFEIIKFFDQKDYQSFN